MKHPITAKQMIVLKRLAVGETPKEVAFELKVSLKTIEYHWAQIKSRLGLKTYVEAAHYAIGKKLVLGILAGLFFVCFAAIAAGNVTLAWDASPDASVTGYRIYWGAASQSYTNSQTGDTNLTMTITNLTPGVRYFFAATAFDGNGLESDFSNETSYRVPTTNDGWVIMRRVRIGR